MGAMTNSISRELAVPDTETAGVALPALRQSRLIGLLQERGQVTVTELVALFDVSRDTIRRDLDLLEQRGLLVRHPRRGHRQQPSGPGRYHARPAHGRACRGQAAHRPACRQLVRDSETLILNGGSTTCYFAAALGDRRNLTIVTNNLRLPAVTPDSCVRAIHFWAASTGASRRSPSARSASRRWRASVPIPR